MNYLVQRGKVRSQVINVPEGLPELLSDITREVLRCQPTTECLCQFIIDYLHSLIVSREKAAAAKNIIDRALHIVDEIIADMCICDIGRMKADQMAAAMEECFKRFLERKRCEERKEREIIRFDEEDMLDELIRRCRFTEHDLKISRPLIEDAYNRFVDAYMQTAEGTEGTEALYQYFKERERKRAEEQAQKKAAVKIQALFRGYKVRRSIFIDKEPTKAAPVAVAEEEEEEASNIQQFDETHTTSDVAESGTAEVCDPPSLIDAAPPAKEVEAEPAAPVAEELPPPAEPEPIPSATAPEAATVPEPAPAPAPAPEPEPEPVQAETAAEAEPPAEEPAAEAQEPAPAAE